MQSNPLRAIEQGIHQKLMDETRLKSIIVPGGRDDTTDQFPDAVFKAGWENISAFTLVNSKLIKASRCTFNITLDSKNVNLHSRAMDFILWAMFLLTGYQPWKEIDNLLPVFCGYQGHDYESGYSRYLLTFETSFHWVIGEDFIVTEPIVSPIYERIDLTLWTPFTATRSEVIYGS
jgi:hypothetical protein